MRTEEKSDAAAGTVHDHPGGSVTTTAEAPAAEALELTAARNLVRRARWIALLEQWTDRPLSMLAVLLIPLLLIPFLFELSAEADAALRDADYVIWAVFAGTLAAGMIVSPDRLGYLRRHWLDALLVLVPMLTPLRSARTIQLFWAIAAAGRVLEGSRRLVVRRGTGFLLLGASLVVMVAAGLIVSVERDDPSATIRTYGDGLWWAMTTFATVGYGDKYPVTAAGRGIAVALMLLGIAAFGVVTANLAALFVEEQEDDAKSQLRLLDERLNRIEALLVRRRSHVATAANRRRRGRKSAANGLSVIRRRERRRGTEGAPSQHRSADAAAVENGREVALRVVEQ
jgi:voltage-gated potassium channel